MRLDSWLTLIVASVFSIKRFRLAGGGGRKDKARLCGAGLYQVNINISVSSLLTAPS